VSEQSILPELFEIWGTDQRFDLGIGARPQTERLKLIRPWNESSGSLGSV